MEFLKFKIVFISLAILFEILNAQELALKYEIKLIEKIVRDITGKDFPNVCVVNYPVDRIREYSNNLVISSCNQADMVIAGTDEVSSFNKPVLLVGSAEFKKKNYIIGAIFWRKGRPQIMFIEKNLKYFNIELPPEYRRYYI
ncbi:MAG: hypothetical protein ABWJ98_04300 [Hydrogenothermaceae bacterium]